MSLGRGTLAWAVVVAVCAAVGAAALISRAGRDAPAPTPALAAGALDLRPVPLLSEEARGEAGEEEAREEGELARHGRLLAPTDDVVCCNREPAYHEANIDGQAGSGRGAVVYRPGAIKGSVDARTDTLLWHTGYGGWEPSLGIDPEGTIFYGARNSNADTDLLRSDDAGRTWKMVGPAAHRVSLDPFVWVDTTTGRVFDSDIDASVTCPPLSFSDDKGETWTTSVACGVTDHQSITSGPPPKDGAATSGYPNVVYYCAITGGTLSDSSTMTGCSRSLDGGTTWVPTENPAYPLRPGPGDNAPWCDGAAGHAYVGPDGTLYSPRGWCREPYVAMSRDEGASWTRVLVSDRNMPAGAHESGAVADELGNVYYSWVDKTHHPLLAISRDHGATWSKPMDILPPGVTRVSAFTASIDIGAPGRLAMVFMGTETPADTPADESTWNAYVITTTDALGKSPTFRAASVNDQIANPLWKTDCGDIRCGNIGDFLDVVIAPDGTPWAAVVDSCPGQENTCTTFDVGLPRGEAMLAHVVGGPSLRRSVRR